MSFNELESWEDYFPYSPRPLQENMLKFMTIMLEKQKHMVIEAANGTGKTITALAGILPYARRTGKKIVYLARTHSQMDRVIEELQQISTTFKEKQVSGIALRGRGSMCLHPLVEKHATSSKAVQDMCSQLKTAKKCDYWNNMDSDNKVIPVLKELARKPVTAEIILDMAEAAYICPAETAKLALARADVIACSYLYLFDPDIRPSFLENLGPETELSDLIVIIDECHNLPDNVNQITSDEVTTYSIQQAIREAKNTQKYQMVKFLTYLEKYLTQETAKLPYNKEKKVDAAIFLETLDQKINRDSDSYVEVSDQLFSEMIRIGNEIRYKLAQRNKEPKSSLGRTGEFFWRWFDSIGKLSFTHSVEKYKSGNYENMILRLASLDPSIAILPVLEDVHTSLSISGSIGDPDAYMMLTGIDQLDKVSNILPSPYTNSNIQAIVTSEITTTYSKRSPAMWAKLVYSIAAVVENTPKNVGIFAPSYSIMRKIMENGLERFITKPIFHVKQGLSSNENDAMVDQFKEYASKGGAVLVSVLGGRSSEGADFPGDLMQSVVVVGIPYAPPNIRVDAQIKYLEDKFPNRGRQLAYQLPAINRASQAAGRPVRGLNDQAFILLADYRFGYDSVLKQLPGWIRESVNKLPYNPNLLAKKVNEFFANLECR